MQKRTRFRGTSLLTLLLFAAVARECVGEQIHVWIGTEGQHGIYAVTLDSDSGKLSTPQKVADIAGAGFLAQHHKLPMLYATATIDGKSGVAAYQLGGYQPGEQLTLAGHVPTGGGNATHVSVDRSGRFLLSAQYGGGTVCSFRLNKGGGIDERVSLVPHKGGARVVERRQDAPHPHWIGTSPDNRFVFVPDLGLDQVVIYRLDQKTGELIPHGHATTPPGGGPRHMKFTADGRFAYVLNELTLSVSVFAYDANAGKLQMVETVPTISEAEKTAERFVSAAEIRIHPNQRFVYASNRGHDTITVFSREASTGKLTKIQCEPIRGSFPRNFNLDPTGRWLISGGQRSDTLSLFSVDTDTGRLQFGGQVANMPGPICVEFSAAK